MTAEQPAPAQGAPAENPIICSACQNKQRFDVYVCPRCGRVSFFVDGIGEEFRSGEPAP